MIQGTHQFQSQLLWDGCWVMWLCFSTTDLFIKLCTILRIRFNTCGWGSLFVIHTRLHGPVFYSVNFISPTRSRHGFGHRHLRISYLSRFFFDLSQLASYRRSLHLIQANSFRFRRSKLVCSFLTLVATKISQVPKAHLRVLCWRNSCAKRDLGWEFDDEFQTFF